jgi:hypothetical protein
VGDHPVDEHLLGLDRPPGLESARVDVPESARVDGNGDLAQPPGRNCISE